MLVLDLKKNDVSPSLCVVVFVSLYPFEFVKSDFLTKIFFFLDKMNIIQEMSFSLILLPNLV